MHNHEKTNLGLLIKKIDWIEKIKSNKERGNYITKIYDYGSKKESNLGMCLIKNLIEVRISYRKLNKYQCECLFSLFNITYRHLQ